MASLNVPMKTNLLNESTTMPELTTDDAFILSFNALATNINEWAERKGWNADDPKPNPQNYSYEDVYKAALIAHDISKLGLMVTELAEAIEARRHNDPPSDHIPEFTGQEEELADCIVRIMHYSKQRNLRVAEALIAKMAFNETRPYKHGKEA